MKKLCYITSVILLFSSCSNNTKTSNEVNLYSQRHYDVDKILFERFEELTWSQEITHSIKIEKLTRN